MRTENRNRHVKKAIMTLTEFTEADLVAVKSGQPVRCSVAGIDSELLLVSAADYEDLQRERERLHEYEADEREQQAWLNSSAQAMIEFYREEEQDAP